MPFPMALTMVWKEGVVSSMRSEDNGLGRDNDEEQDRDEEDEY